MNEKRKEQKTRDYEFSFFNRNYPSLFCYASFAFRHEILTEKNTQ